METQSREDKRSLSIYFTILILLCAGFVLGARLLGKQGTYLASGYMLTPAVAALITRAFFYKPRFSDANLRFGRARDYLYVWLAGLAITAVSYVAHTLLGAIRWDFSGNLFLARMAEQVAASGKELADTLPPGFTPQMMMWIFVLGGLTVFNIMPGILFGFGEEFSHRGFMFPALYRIRPWVGYLIGGLIWFAWHIPIQFMVPQADPLPLGTTLLTYLILAIGSLATFAYLAVVYLKSRSVFVTSLAHITMNNAAAAVSYFVVIQNQLLANMGLTLTMLLVVAVMLARRMLPFDRDSRLPLETVPEKAGL